MAAGRQECSICIDIFKNPKLIPCHHSFCYKCLEDYVKVNLSNGRFNCPMCRKSVELPPGGVISFKTNVYIESDSSENLSCDICGPKSVACSRCLECEENLCQTCCYVHEKSKASRHHKISDLGTLEPEMKGKIRQRIFCDQHPEDEFRLVCKDCKALICVLCKAIKHENHATETVSDAAAEVKKNIQIKMDQCSDKVRRITDSEREADSLDKKIIDAERKEIKALEDQRLQLIKVIDQKVAKMKDKIQNVYKDLRQQNAALKRGMKEELKKCSTANDNARQIIDQGTDIDIIKKGSDLEQLLSTAVAETVKKPMTRMDTDLFSPVKIKVRELIPFIGIMRDSTEMSVEEREKKEREIMQIQAHRQRKPLDYMANRGNVAKDDVDADNSCIICMCPKTDPKALSCGHSFCSGCIGQMLEHKPVCPVCGIIVGTLTGDQPKNGKMEVNTSKFDLAGYEGYGSIVITYDFPAGRQEPNHPSPGKWYTRLLRIAYLPNTSEGRTVCSMLQLAFKRRLVFIISQSRTTGTEGLTWNDIHHKTNSKPGGQFGYPDPEYLSRVKYELAAKGITEADLPPEKTGLSEFQLY